MKTKIVLKYENEREAKTVSQAVSPDNMKTPMHLGVDTFDVGNQVVASVNYEGDNIMTLASTIDDLLRCATIAEKTFLAIRKRTES